jgi:single-strand DNA-binding protein
MSIRVTVSDCRAGGEPQVFGKEGGGKVARLSIAHNERSSDGAGHTKEETTWLPVVAFGPAARFIEENVHKGARLTVEGELHNRTFEKDGQKHTVSEVHVIPGRGSVELLKAAGDRPGNGDEPRPAA